MECDQKLVALKRAYADIILNTSKEAAARVMVSERKSQQLEHELRVTKEEAIQMMLRLKKMMDDKINEAKKTSQNQKEKIDELESQLQEAEDIVNELREELRDVQAKIERITRNDIQQLDKHENATSVVAFEVNRQYFSQSILSPPQLQNFSLAASEKEKSYLNRTEYPEYPSQLIQIRNSYCTKPELPSIILRSKKHNIYRNGFTHRIQACERNVMDGELPLLRQPSGVCSKGKEGEKTDKSTCKTTTDGADKVFNTRSEEAVHKNGRMSCGYELQATERIPDKVKATPKYRKVKSTLRMKNPDKLFMNVCGTPGNPNPISGKNNAQPDQDPNLTAPKLSSDKAGMATTECAKNAELYGDYNNGESPVDVSVPDQDPSLTAPKLSSDKAGMATTECAKNAEMYGDYNNGESPVDVSVPIVREGISTEKSDIQVSTKNLKKINEPVLHSEVKTTDATSGCPSLPVEKKVLKYTFQRKRKRGTVNISNGNVSVENITPARKKEKQIESAVEKSCLEARSSLEKRL